MRHRDPETFDILLIEDNEADVFMMQEVMKELGQSVNLHVTMDGREGMEFLLRNGRFADAPRPDLVLLDLNLPKKDGREVLAEIKQSDDLKSIPTVVLTTSESEEDISRCYMLHANSYITKPVGFGELLEMVRGIQDFWFGIVKLPSKHKR